MNEEVGSSKSGLNTTSFIRKRKQLPEGSSESYISVNPAIVPTQPYPGERGGTTPIRFLCSETFIDQWSDLVANLATRGWKAPTGTKHVSHHRTPKGRIGFVDTSLMDLAGVDVENRANGAMIFCLLSATMGSGFSHLLKRVIDIASLSRYTTLEVIICVDIAQDSSCAEEIAKLQNATMQYQGMPTTAVSFNLVSPASLASFTAESLLSFDSTSPTARMDFDIVERHLEDRKTWERLLFLLSLIPSLGVTQAFVLARGFDVDNGEMWLTRCLERGRTESDQINVPSHQAVMQQLSFVLSTPLGSNR